MNAPIRKPEEHCLVRSTLAKTKVFEAQDAAELVEDVETREKVRRMLARARGELEAVDRVLRDRLHR